MAPIGDHALSLMVHIVGVLFFFTSRQIWLFWEVFTSEMWHMHNFQLNPWLDCAQWQCAAQLSKYELPTFDELDCNEVAFHKQSIHAILLHNFCKKKRERIIKLNRRYFSQNMFCLHFMSFPRKYVKHVEVKPWRKKKDLVHFLESNNSSRCQLLDQKSCSGQYNCDI